MKLPLFRSIRSYWANVFSEVRSIWAACATTFPYLFSKGDLHKEVTEQYPDPISARTPDDLPARSRGLLSNQIEICTGCGECAKNCPTQCIRLETEPGMEENKLWISEFEIDFARCIFCGLCTEVCQPASLTHTRQYEGAVYQRADLKVNFGRGSVTEEQREKWLELRRNLGSEKGLSP